MNTNAWSRQRQSRRDFIRGIGVALAPAIAACRTTAKPSGAGGGRAARPVRGGTLTSNLQNDVVSLDYAFAGDATDKAIIANCVEPLLTLDTQGQPAGLLATSWENPDDHTYVFKLRPGVTFQDGTDFNADAVDYSMGFSIRRCRSTSSSIQPSGPTMPPTTPT